LSERANALWVILLSLLVGMMLTIFPLPEWAEPFRPEWVLLILVYWCMALPNRVGVGLSWTMGLLIDVAQGSLLGQHALGYAVIAFLVIEAHQRVRVFPLWQQALVLLTLLLLQQFLMTWIDGMIGQAPETVQVFAPALVGMLLWPWIFVILRHARRSYRVA
jgi:rod shape-determining protein MreD